MNTGRKRQREPQHSDDSKRFKIPRNKGTLARTSCDLRTYLGIALPVSSTAQAADDATGEFFHFSS